MLGRLTGACRRWWGGGRWGSGSGGLGGRGSSSSSSSRRRSGRGRGRVFGGCRLAHGVCGLHKMLKMGEEEEKGGVSRVRLPKWPRRAGFEGFIFVPLRPGAARVRAGSHEGAECNLDTSGYLFARDHAPTCTACLAATISPLEPSYRQSSNASSAWRGEQCLPPPRRRPCGCHARNPPAAPLLAGCSSGLFVERGKMTMVGEHATMRKWQANRMQAACGFPGVWGAGCRVFPERNSPSITWPPSPLVYSPLARVF